MPNEIGAFPRDRQLTTIAIAYKNPDVALVADAVFPRKPVNLKNFDYVTYPDGQMYTVPDTRVGERSKMSSSELTGTKVPAYTEDNGHSTTLTADDVSQAPPGFDPRTSATEYCTNIVLLAREVRAAALAFDATKYGADFKQDVSATHLWSDYTDGDPLSDIIAGLDAALMRPNVLLFGQAVWSKLRSHPKIVQAVKGTAATAGLVTRQEVADLFEVQEVLVGSSFVNTKKAGQQPVLARVWGKHALAFYRDSSVTTAGGITFGITAQLGTRIAGSKPVDVGLNGGIEVRAGESVKELIVAPSAAFFFENAVA